VKARELGIPGAWVFEPEVFPDRRGLFVAPFQGPAFREAVGADFVTRQSNVSVSAAGVVRGVHFADVPPGQAKYVTCLSGRLLDVVVVVRVGSPTFGRWEAVELDPASMRSVYLSAGLGHAFLALEEATTASYLCSEPYNPAGERGISPLDPALALPWPAGLPLVLSDKDREAPTLARAQAAGLLPRWEGRGA